MLRFGVMAGMSEALVNPEILRWARERAAMSVVVLADKLKTSAEKLVAWESGDKSPSFAQAEAFADKVHVPFGFLFLPAPPEDKLPIPDLRTQAGAPRDRFSADFLDLLRDVMFQRDWFRDYLLEQGAEPMPFVGRFSADASPEIVAADIRSVLGIAQNGAVSGDLSKFSEICERAGIWVMKTGFVGSNNHRTLSVSDFRGFAVADVIAPLVVINGRDAKAAQTFTLAHELAHLWLGQSGISDPYLDRNGVEDSGTEGQCNAIAAELLVPRTGFLDLWNDLRPLPDNAQNLARYFKVSRVVIARRALEFGKITWSMHHAFFEQERKDWDSIIDDGGGSGNFYANTPVKYGKRFTRAVLTSAMSGNILLRDAGSLLHMKPKTLQELYNRQKRLGL